MDLRSIFALIAQKFILIILVVVAFMTASAVITSLYIVPQYTASATLIVNKTMSSNAATGDYTYNDLLLTQKLVNTCSVVITSDSVLSAVVENLDLDMTLDELRRKLSVSGVNDTEVIQVTVTDEIPQRAVDIANEITRVCPDEIIRTVKAGSVELIDYARLPSEPSSPNMTNNILIAGFLGLALIMLILIAIEFFNRTIKTSDDVENLFSLPVLGQLPSYRR